MINLQPPPVDLPHIHAAIRAAATAHGALKAILFGSYARGTATHHSDLDVIFIEETSAPFLQRLDKYICQLSDKLHLPVEVLVYNPREFTALQGGPFLRNVLPEGVIVYEQ